MLYLGVRDNFWSLIQTYEGNGAGQTLVTPYKTGNGHFHFLYLYFGATMSGESAWGLVLGVQNFSNGSKGSHATAFKLGDDLTFSVDNNRNICISGFRNYSSIHLYVF